MQDSPKPHSGDKGLPFKISPRLIDLFGRELVARTEAAIAELVKNAYDSDARHVHLKFENVKHAGGSFIISDDGDGMSLADLREKWMVIGTRDKLDRPRTNRNRRKVGEKGIGRLGAHKLSNHTVLKTKKAGETKWIILDIDWSKYYTDEHSFEEIIHPYRTEPGRPSDHGTTLILQDLRDGFTKENFERLQAELTLLIPPLPGIRDFKIEIESNEFPEFKGELKPAVLKAANYVLNAEYDGAGRLSGTLRVKGETKEKRIDTPVVAPHCGAFGIILYVYVLKRESFEGAPIQLAKVKRVLDVFKGIRVYRDNFKVGIYGDQGDDWLRMDEEHIRAHEVVIHSKQVMGAVHITRDGNPNLVDTTNRDRLVANDAFFDLVSVTKVAVNEINERRWEERKARDEARTKRKSPIYQAFDQIEKAADKDFLIPQDVKQEIHQALDRVRQEYQHHVVRLEDELQMYRNLASLGISTAAFAHETEAVGLDLELYLNEMKDALVALPQETRVKLDSSFRKVCEAGMRSMQLVDLLLEFVRQRKQHKGPVVLPDLLDNLLKRYEPFLARVGIKTFVRSQPSLPRLYCTPMDMEAVFINLLTNAVWAMRDAPKRELHFDIQSSPKKVVVTVSDTGVGIDAALAQKIFMPFFTTKGPKGIGLGLTIVRDTLRKYRGDIVPIIPGLLKGATFEIGIPIEKPKEHL
jgi:signal transduction histidine kinase